VSQQLQEKLSDPAVIRGIEQFGVGLADGFEQALAFAQRIPWATIGEAMLPPWVQTAVITGWGLNKLTGGALGGIVGELGKGLIKGVLGMNAGVVNARAGVVNVTGAGLPGAAGPVPAGGGASKVGSALSLLSKVFLVGMAAEAAAQFAGPIQDLGKEIGKQTGLADFGKAFDAWRQDADWPFGTKNRPDWAGGDPTSGRQVGQWDGVVGPTPSTGPLPADRSGNPIPVKDQTSAERLATIKAELAKLPPEQRAAAQKAIDATHDVRKGISIFQHAMTTIGAAQRAAVVQAGIGTVRAMENDTTRTTAAVKLAADRDANAQAATKAAVDRAKTAVNTTKTAIDAAKSVMDRVRDATTAVGAKVGGAKAAIDAVRTAEERTKTAIDRKDFSPSFTVQNNLRSAFYVDGRRFSQEIDRSTVVVRPGQAPVPS
jgi:hypothetical protein